MEMIISTSVRPWGNSQGIRIPKEFLSALRINPGDECTLRVENEQLILEKKVQRKSLMEYAKPFGGKLGPYEEFDFGEGIGIERWLDDTD